MSRLHTSPDSGSTWNPVRSLRTAPGGSDVGQVDKTASNTALLGAAPVPVPLWTVSAGKTGFISDMEIFLSASSCTVSLQVGGITIWSANLSSSQPAYMRRAWILAAAASQVVQLVFSAAAVGTPTASWNVAAWEH